MQGVKIEDFGHEEDVVGVHVGLATLRCQRRPTCGWTERDKQYCSNMIPTSQDAILVSRAFEGLQSYRDT